VKAALIVLILVAVVFVVVVVLGVGQNNSQSAPAASATSAESYSPPSWSQTLNGMLDPFSPKLKLQTNSFNVDPKLAPVKIQVPAKHPSALSVALFGHPVRKATFYVNQQQPYPCAGIVYQAPQGAGGTSSTLDQKLNPQPNEKSETTVDCPTIGVCTALPAPPQAKVKDPTKANFTILDKGGTITLKGLGTKPCTIQLE
jgi:hypothetical protein